ncbi:hypothetical protein [uncultured Thiothrix sp.]|uniref:hypothetical protein n=1 Tax=uncultured Thiothrix sp. TaxID=223185 RepID=UPI00263292AF|nr:hypothetical protein [uncultured Thiothrix sp.]
MEFTRQYFGASQVKHDAQHSSMNFVPDALRQPTFFRGELAHHLPFREAMSALNEVVISDTRYKPRDKIDYKTWLKAQEEVFLTQALGQQAALAEELSSLRYELKYLQRQEQKIKRPYLQAKSNYFQYLYEFARDTWIVLDPVISVHPDCIFFECFSEDESSYGKLSCSYAVFKNIQEQAFGTTNIDYSPALYQEFQKIRDYKTTQFVIDPSGFAVKTSLSEDFKEEKIDLPDSWVRGFLQVSSAMSLPQTELSLHPMDLYNVLLFLKRHQEKASPRSLRFILKPDQPIEIQLDPWGELISCPRSFYTGNTAQTIRIWGRRRLFILERLIPIATRFKINLLGSGLPSFWIAEMEGMNFTLGLSGWSANDFSRLGNFDLMAPRGEVDSATAELVFKALNQTWCETAESLAKRLQLEINTVTSALGIYAQYGRVLYDLDTGLYRLRELSKDSLPMQQLRFTNEREQKAQHFISANLVNLSQRELSEQRTCLAGEVTDNAKVYKPNLTIDADLRLVAGECQCHFYIQHKLRQGPCEHLLALRLFNQH